MKKEQFPKDTDPLTLRSNCDYYPVYLDIIDLKMNAEASTQETSVPADPYMDQNQEQKIVDAEELLEIAIQHDCSALQTLVLLLKNAFEGHCYLVFEITAGALIRQGTFLFDPAEDRPCELSLHFIDHLEDYSTGLHGIWKKLQTITPQLEEICFESLLLFLLSTRLFKLPISALKPFEITKFRKLPDQEKRYYRHLFRVSVLMDQAMMEQAMIDRIDQLYEERFQEYLIRVSSRDNLVMQLKTKLLYANDPMIRTVEELEQRYFSFLVEKELIRDSGKVVVKQLPWEDDTDAEGTVTELTRSIRHLFRVLSKNCKEAFTASADTSPGFDATRFFMDANAIFNETNTSLTGQLLQYHRLAALFIQVYNTRKLHALPAIFPDHTVLESDHLRGQLNEETVRKLRLAVTGKISAQKEKNRTSFRWKHLSDDELAEIHKTYLKKQIEYLDQRVKDILTEINTVMREKTKGSVIN